MKTGLIIAAWAITCATAFLVGRTASSPSTDADQANADAKTPTVSSRSASHSSASQAGNRRSGSRVGRNSSEAQIEALQDKVRDLKNLNDPIARAEGFLQLIRDLGPDEFLAAVSAYREGGINNEQFGEYRLLLSAWANVAPLEALDYAQENTRTQFARSTILSSWAKNDPEGAVSWARENFDNNGNEDRANPWMASIISGIASTDVGRATQLLEELPFSRERGEALDTIFKEISANGSEEAKNWISQLTDPRLQQGAAARLAGQLAQEDPQSAAEWAATLGPEVMARSAGTIIDNWAETDLQAARAWVEGQSTEIIAASGPNLVKELIQQGDTNTASEWLSNYEGNPAFDDSVRSLVRHSLTDEPVAAADWIMKLTSERDQERTFHRVLGNWIQSDREGALDYINNNPVPESIRTRASRTQQ